MTSAIIAVILVLLVIWGIGVRQRLVAMDENVNRAMRQIGIQLSSRFDALMVLLELTKNYDASQSKTLVETVRFQRCAIDAQSTPDEVLKQEGVIDEALETLSAIAKQHPEWKTHQNYKKCMDAVDSYERMVRTSLLIYNDSVTKLNRELRRFPTSLLGGLLGFHQRDYLEMVEEKAGAPGVR